MLEKRFYDEVMSINYPICHKKRSIGPDSSGNDLVSRPTHTGMWNTGDNAWTKKKAEYVKIKCVTYKTKIRTYYNCNQKVPMYTK